MTEDLDQPATKRFVKDAVDDLAQITAKGFEQQERRLIEHVDQRFNELRDHFDAAIEIIEDRLAGANKDEISGLKDADQRLADRVTVLERHTGLPTAN